jgi:assimilatory nitrate reductase catalytic subunit
VQWPVREGTTKPQARFFADGRFYANDRRARFIAPEAPELRTQLSAERPLRLNTGRVRDQWHTMTRTGLSPRLGQHIPEPFVEIHPVDAAEFKIIDGGYARLTTDYGDCVLKVVVSEHQQRGMLFAPIHWNDETAGFARVGGLVAPITDPFSGQPENKATPVSIAPQVYAQRGFVLSRKPLDMPLGLQWARVAVNGGVGYLLSDNTDVETWQAWWRPSLGDDVAEFEDIGRGVYRAVSFVEDRIEACLFIGPAEDALSWDAVKDLFAAETVSDEQRRILLSGKSADGQATAGPIVCACFGVGRTTICDAIAAGAGTAAEIGARLKAGTNCGSCIPELKRLIAASDTAPDEQRKVAAS